MTEYRARIRFQPAPLRLGENIAPGARVAIEGLGCGVVSGIIERDAPYLGLVETLGEDWLPALSRAAKAGADGESGVIDVDLRDFLPW